MKTIFTLISLFLTFNLFSQEILEKKSNNKPRYSENSEISVFYSDNSNDFNSNQKPVGFFVNDVFIENQENISLLNPNKIADIKIEKKEFELNGTEYFGKVFIKLKPDYYSKLLSLKKLSEKYLKLNENPVIYQVNEKVIKSPGNVILVDENYILKIVVTEVETSNKNVKLNLVKIVTRTPENIKKANQIRIKGIENIKQVAN